MTKAHIHLAHSYWEKLLQIGDVVIDATCGNGHDTLFISQLILNDKHVGKLIAIDTQEEAIKSTQQRLQEKLASDLLQDISFYQQCHSIFPETILKNSVKLIVYNLGYLPGSDKTHTTLNTSTCTSVEHALTLICRGGAISITCYPGHKAGQIEEEALLKLIEKLPSKEWRCCYHRWINRQDAPSLIWIERK